MKALLLTLCLCSCSLLESTDSTLQSVKVPASQTAVVVDAFADWFRSLPRDENDEIAGDVIVASLPQLWTRIRDTFEQ